MQHSTLARLRIVRLTYTYSVPVLKLLLTNTYNLYTIKYIFIQLAVPPTLAAGDWSVDSEGDGEGSSGDLHDGVSESDNNN